MAKKSVPFLLTCIQGAIGKEIVVKHYKQRVVVTKYPDMDRIVASEKQRDCRNLFKEAVAYAKDVMADPLKKAAWERRIRQKRKLFVLIIKEYMRTAKNV